MKISEKQLSSIVRESVYRILNEHQFDNVKDDSIVDKYENYDVVNVPDWCLPYLVNGETYGYTEEELTAMQRFEQRFEGKIINGMNVGDLCVPEDDAEPSFTRSNDVMGKLGDFCYTFFIPLK